MLDDVAAHGVSGAATYCFVTILRIFDEASQIRPEDAVCAIARGKQTVVAGDDRQLPPSKFLTAGDDDLEEEDEVEEALTKGYESILDVMAILPERMLQWHWPLTR